MKCTMIDIIPIIKFALTKCHMLRTWCWVEQEAQLRYDTILCI